LTLPNRDLDTGSPTALGEYSLADKTYEKLVSALKDDKFAKLPPELAENILAFFGQVDVLPGDTSRHHKRTAHLRRDLEMMAAASSSDSKVAN